MISEVAQTIFTQLGARRFVAMTGAKQFQHSPTALTFKVARRNVRVTLDPSDTYTVTTSTLSGKVCKTDSDVYAENLQRVFTEQTGLYTSL